MSDKNEKNTGNDEIKNECKVLEAYKVAARCNHDLLKIAIDGMNGRDT
jgi:plasmid rolling circle replication initiator protein Rep